MTIDDQAKFRPKRAAKSPPVLFAAIVDAQSSPYCHLLRPKAGGLAFVLDAMGDALHAILDVTIVCERFQAG